LRQKLVRYNTNLNTPNIIEPGKELFENIKGNWNKLYFKNDNPIVLELACGRGEYTVGLSRVYPNKNFIGVDIKGDRMFVGSKIALDEGLNNVAFLRTMIQNIEGYFDTHEISEIWITFPDPRPKLRDAKRRLTSPRFLDIYKRIMKPGGWIHFKTDNTPLFEYSIEVLKERNVAGLVYTFDLYHHELLVEHHGIRTNYERKFHDIAGEDIKYLRFRIN
jgi:tRNA (guanine-N7-)-methyltransferase